MLLTAIKYIAMKQYNITALQPYSNTVIQQYSDTATHYYKSCCVYILAAALQNKHCMSLPCIKFMLITAQNLEQLKTSEQHKTSQ